MPPVSLLEGSFARSHDQDLAAFREAQRRGGGGSDPFSDPEADTANVFEYMPEALVPEALRRLAAAHAHGSIIISLRNPTVDERLKGATAPCSIEPFWWIEQCRRASVPLKSVTHNLSDQELLLLW